MKTECNLKQAIENWKNGQTVSSAELGGIGPAYEQAIQILLWETLARWEGDTPKGNGVTYPKDYEDHFNKVADELNESLGFTGAQGAAAKATAFQFMVFGYEEMMDKLPEDRWIWVSKKFPSWELANASNSN